MNDAIFRKIMENVRKHRGIKLVTTESGQNCLISESIHHTTKFFTDNLLAIDMSKTEVLMNKHVYLRLSKLELMKTLMNLFWYDYVKPKYHEKQNCVIWIQEDPLYT